MLSDLAEWTVFFRAPDRVAIIKIITSYSQLWQERRSALYSTRLFRSSTTLKFSDIKKAL